MALLLAWINWNGDQLDQQSGSDLAHAPRNERPFKAIDLNPISLELTLHRDILGQRTLGLPRATRVETLLTHPQAFRGWDLAHLFRSADVLSYRWRIHAIVAVNRDPCPRLAVTSNAVPTNFRARAYTLGGFCGSGELSPKPGDPPSVRSRTSPSFSKRGAQ